MERIGSDVRRELDRFGPGGSLGELVDAWPAAVGDAIARNAWPARVNRDGTLVVHCADSVWAFELGQRAAEIATRLGVVRLRFVPGPVPEAGPEVAAAVGRSPVEAGPDELALAAALAAEIGNIELREAVARAAAASLAAAARQP